MYRGRAELQDGLDLGGAVHWLWHLRQGMHCVWFYSTSLAIWQVDERWLW